MKWLHFVGAMVLIGIVDWAVLWLLRFSVRQIQRGVVKLWG
jgi:hypothetical protein